MNNVLDVIALARGRKAADVHIIAGAPILFRIERELIPITKEKLSPEMTKKLSYELLTPEQITEFEKNRDYDFMFADQNRHRHRVNISYNDGSVGAVIRLLPSNPMLLDALNLPPIVTQVCVARKGLILITGSTSQGKTTTLNAMIDHINRTARKHVVTIEDPIEYVHESKQSIVRQREIGKDTNDFKIGLRAALRQDPDVIAIGEMRDYETIKIALTAAETGVLVMSTLHIISIDKIIERMLSYAPDGSDGHMRSLLAESLLCVIHQELLSTIAGGKQIACEILVANDAVRNVMRHRSTFHLRNSITTGQRWGMQTMKQSLDRFLEQGVISDTVYEQVATSYR